MEGSPFLPLPEGMLIDRVEQTDTQLTVTVISTRTEAACPRCGCPSEHVHSQYQRTVHDTPCGGYHVLLRLCVRKFFCLTLTCSRKVFAEQLPTLVQPWARGSLRLLEELKAIGLSASAEVSERLTPRLGMKVKAPTLLRYLRTIPDPPKEALDSWLERAKQRQVTELSSFVNGIRRDYAAVRAAFSFKWSNGITQGHVNQLKFLKRQMFGRVHLDLLRIKVLHAV